MEGLGNLIAIIGAVLAGLGLAVVALAWAWRAEKRPAIIESLERSMVSNQRRLEEYQRRQDAQEAEMDELRRQMDELRASRIADHALLQEWITYARRLAEMVRASTGQEPPPEPGSRARPVTNNDLARLARAIEARFSVTEINDLAFDLGLDHAISGDTLATRARSLVDAARKRGLIVRLIEMYREQRPDGGM